MKVLMINNIAGVSSTLTNELNKKGIKTKLVSTYDDYGFYLMYSEYQKIVKNVKLKYLYILKECKKYDIIHIHYTDRMIKYIKKIFPNKKVIIHYHGSDIRHQHIKKLDRWIMADTKLISTKDLRFEGFIYLENPVDINHFQRKTSETKDRALYFKRKFENNEGIKQAMEFCNNNNYCLTYLDLSKNKILYPFMPHFLKQFGIYIQNKFEPIKNEKITDVLSITSLQSLYTGLKVYVWGKPIYEYNIKHDSDIVINKLIKIYELVLNVKK